MRVIASRSCRDTSMMHLLRCLFFLEAHYQFHIVAVHVPGKDNVWSDDLSRDRHLTIPTAIPPPAVGGRKLDVSMLDEEVQFYFQRGVATSTLRTYRAGVNRYISFCFAYNVCNPFPASEYTLCYFVVSLAKEGLASSTIKTYLAAVRHGQIERGFQDLREGSSLPRLHMIQNGVRRERAERGPPQALRLPITPPILLQMKRALISSPVSYDAALVWAAAVTCFFGFFRAGELCPVRAMLDYVARRGTGPGIFFRFEGGSPLTKNRFVERVRGALVRAGIETTVE